MKFRSLFLLSLLAICTHIQAADFESLVREKQIKVEVVGSHAFEGNSIQLNIENLTDETLSVELEAGRLFVSKNFGVQDMVIAEPLLVEVQGKSKKSPILSAYCTEAAEGSPNGSDYFDLGKQVPKLLRDLLAIANKNKEEDVLNQRVVWAYEKDEPLTYSGIYNGELFDQYVRRFEGGHKVPINRNVVLTLAGKKLVEPKSRQSASEQLNQRVVHTIRVHQFRGDALFIFEDGGSMNAGFYDPDGRLLKPVWDNVSRASGFVKVKFDVRLENPADGVYELRCISDKGEVHKKSFRLRNGKLVSAF